MTNQNGKKPAHQMSFMLPIDTVPPKTGVKGTSTSYAEKSSIDVDAARKMLIEQLERSGLARRKL